MSEHDETSEDSEEDEDEGDRVLVPRQHREEVAGEVLLDGHDDDRQVVRALLGALDVLHHVRAARVVLATGAQRTGVFSGVAEIL